MPRFLIVLVTLVIGAIVALAATITLDSLVTKSRTTLEPRSAANPVALPPPPPPPLGTTPAPVPSAALAEKDKELTAARKRIKELEAAKGDATTSSGWFDWLKSVKLPPAPSTPPAPTTMPPAPKVAAPPATIDRSKALDALTETVKKLKEKIEAKPTGTESKSVPPTASIPSIPPPPATTSVTLKGPPGASEGFFGKLFGGGCSVRKEAVTLPLGKWQTFTGSGKDECVVVLDWSSAVIIAKDGKGDFLLEEGISRNPRQVKLLAGNAAVEYSTCDPRRVRPGARLDFYCNEIETR